MFCGLASSSTAATLTDMKYGFTFPGNNNLTIYESGTAANGGYTPTTVSSTDVCTITYDGVNIKYYKNGGLIKSTTVPTAQTSYYLFLGNAASSTYQISNVIFAPLGPIGATGASGVTGPGFTTITGSTTTSSVLTANGTNAAIGQANLQYDGYVVTPGMVLSTSSSGLSLTERQLGGATRLYNSIISSTDGSRLITVVAAGNIWTSSDSGVTWTERTTGASRPWLYVASSSNGQYCVAVTYGDGIWGSSDSGATWTDRTTTPALIRNLAWSGVASSADGATVAVTVTGGTVYINTAIAANGSWNAVYPLGGSTPANWAAIAMSADGLKIAAVVNNGNIWITQNRTTNTWTSRATSLYWTAIAMSADGTKLIAAETLNIWMSIDGGVTWTMRATVTGTSITSVAISTDGIRLAATSDNGYLFTSIDSGVNWSSNKSIGSKRWLSVALSSDGFKIASCVYGGHVYTGSYLLNGPLFVGSINASGNIAASGSITAGGDITAFSDMRLKRNVVTIDSALGKISMLRGVYYDRIDLYGRKVGLIAQEVEEFVPEVVTTGTDEEQTKSIAYGNLVGLLIEGIKQLDQRCSDLEKKLNDK